MNPLASVSGHAALFWTVRLFESGACCANCSTMILIHRSVGINSVAGANHHRRCGNRPPGDPNARLEHRLVRPDQRRRIVLARHAPTGLLPTHRRHRRESARHIEIHQPPKQLRHRRAVVPSHTGIDGQNRQHAPVVGEVERVHRLAKILVRIAKSDAARVRHADQKIRKIRPVVNGFRPAAPSPRR